MAGPSNTLGVLSNNFYGQTPAGNGQFNGVTLDNMVPIDIPTPYTPPTTKNPGKPPGKRSAKVSRSPYTSQSGVITPEALQQEDAGRGVGTEAAKTTADVLQDEGQSARNAQKILAAGEFIVDVMNANSAYQNVKGQAQINIMLARNSANDAIYRGREAALSRQSEGFRAGEDASLAMAAQGQDVGGAAVSKVKGSYEAMGYMNAAREEINSMREAMGYQLEEINYEYQANMAGVNRDLAIIGSGLNTAAKFAAYS